MNPNAIEEFRRISNVLRNTSEAALYQATSVEDLIALARACIASEWDVTPGDMSPAQWVAAIKHGEAPRFDDSDGGLAPLPPVAR